MAEAPPSERVCVSGLPEDLQPVQLQSIFGACGTPKEDHPVDLQAFDYGQSSFKGGKAGFDHTHPRRCSRRARSSAALCCPRRAATRRLSLEPGYGREATQWPQP